MLPSLSTEPLADSPYQYHFSSSGDCSIPAACASMRLPSVSVQGGHDSSKHGWMSRGEAVALMEARGRACSYMGGPFVRLLDIGACCDDCAGCSTLPTDA